MTAFTRSSFSYELPEHLIAEHPMPERSDSKLLVWDPCKQSHAHAVFKQLPDFLSEKDLLVFNDTRVQHARLLGHKQSGGAVEVFIERLWPNGSATAMIKASKAPKVGALLDIHGYKVVVESIQKPLYRVRAIDISFTELMETHGHVPLPPYIRRPDSKADFVRYQTVYSKASGSAAAPTAGLHFDEPLLEHLKQKGIGTAYLTLHVGLGTFAPVREEDLSKHQMHSEWFEINADTANAIEQTRQAGGRVVAVGTTSLRALETAAQAQALPTQSQGAQSECLKPYAGESQLFITPGFNFRIVDALITNFHLPESTLLMLVSAFAGYDQTKSTYQLAVENNYRFFSFGDAMFIKRRIK